IGIVYTDPADFPKWCTDLLNISLISARDPQTSRYQPPNPSSSLSNSPLSQISDFHQMLTSISKTPITILAVQTNQVSSNQSLIT
ncbi:MAG: hypothetical protein ABG776_19920, partial [Cyanobacteria bacterium J06555_13]